MATIPPLGFETYFLESSDEYPEVPEILVMSAIGNEPTEFLGKKIVRKELANEDQVIENSLLKVTLETKTGFIRSVKYGSKSTKLEEDILSYTGSGGAYLFLPNGEPSPISKGNQLQAFRLIKGSLVQEAQTVRGVSSRRARLYALNDVLGNAIDMIYEVNLEDLNSELVARFTTDVNSDGDFYTDLNGFQVQRRTLREDKPIQFNFYPVTSSIWVQDESTRFTVHTRQAMAGSSRQNGAVELMMDRKLSNDDNRGLSEGVTDNVPHHVQFHLLFENKKQNEFGMDLSPLSTSLSDYLNHPVHTLAGTLSASEWKEKYELSFTAINPSKFPRDLHFLSFRARGPLTETNEAVLQFTRYSYDGGFGSQTESLKVNPFALFTFASPAKVQEKTLTLMHHKSDLTSGDSLTVKPRDLKALTMELVRSDSKTVYDTKPPAPVKPPVIPVEPPIQDLGHKDKEPKQQNNGKPVDIPVIELPVQPQAEPKVEFDE